MGCVRRAAFHRETVTAAVTVETKGAISIIRINRPERLNAINQDVAVELQCAFKAFDADDNRRVAVLSSVGERAFSSGADLSNLPELWRAIPIVVPIQKQLLLLQRQVGSLAARSSR
jgi:enoyl-CoA hydratase/carnithine racemase